MSIVSSPTTTSYILTSLSSFIVCIQAYETIYVWDLLKVSIVERICWPFQDTSLGQRLQLFKYLESWSFSIFQVFLFSSGTLLVFELPRHESQSQGLKHWPAKQCRLRGASVYQIAWFFVKTPNQHWPSRLRLVNYIVNLFRQNLSKKKSTMKFWIKNTPLPSTHLKISQNSSDLVYRLQRHPLVWFSKFIIKAPPVQAPR